MKSIPLFTYPNEKTTIWTFLRVLAIFFYSVSLVATSQLGLGFLFTMVLSLVILLPVTNIYFKNNFKVKLSRSTKIILLFILFVIGTFLAGKR